MRSVALAILVSPVFAQVYEAGGYRFNLAPYTRGDVSNFTVFDVEAAPDPARGACVASPSYFFETCKAAGTADFPERESAGVVRPVYSRWRDDNSDGSFYLVGKGSETPPESGRGQSVIYRSLDHSVFRILDDVPSHEAHEFRWDYSGKHPLRMYHVDDACGFHRYDVAPDGRSATNTLLHDFARDFPGCGRILNDVEGDSSADSRYWAFMVTGPYGEAGCEEGSRLKAVIVYDLAADRIVGTLDRSRFAALGGQTSQWDACGFRPNMADISPLGTAVVLLWSRNDRLDPFDGPHAYPLDFSTPGVRVCNDETHSGWAFDEDGSEMFVCQVDNVNWPGREADTIAATNIRTGETRTLFYHADVGFETGWHFGRFYNSDIRGWVYVSSYSETASSSSFLRGHAFMLELKSWEKHPRIWRIADLRNNYREEAEDAYEREAFSPLSGDGQTIRWGADWITDAGGSNPRITSTGVVNTYEVKLPPGWWKLLKN